MENMQYIIVFHYEMYTIGPNMTSLYGMIFNVGVGHDLVISLLVFEIYKIKPINSATFEDLNFSHNFVKKATCGY